VYTVNTVRIPRLGLLNILEDGKYICGWAVEKMSKSMFNVVNPDMIVDKYGPELTDKAVYTVNTVRIPRLGLLNRTEEHFVHTKARPGSIQGMASRICGSRVYPRRRKIHLRMGG